MRPTGADRAAHIKRMRKTYAQQARLRQQHMNQRKRKLAGTVALLVLVTVYALLALAVAVVLQVRQANHLVEVLYYVIAGLLWVLPAGALIKWMQKPDA